MLTREKCRQPSGDQVRWEGTRSARILCSPSALVQLPVRQGWEALLGEASSAKPPLPPPPSWTGARRPIWSLQRVAARGQPSTAHPSPSSTFPHRTAAPSALFEESLSAFSRIHVFPVTRRPIFKPTFHELGVKSGKKYIMNCGKKWSLGISVPGGFTGPRKSLRVQTIVIIFRTRTRLRWRERRRGKRASRLLLCGPPAALRCACLPALRTQTPGPAPTAPPFYYKSFYYRIVSLSFCPVTTSLSSTPYDTLAEVSKSLSTSCERATYPTDRTQAGLPSARPCVPVTCHA